MLANVNVTFILLICARQFCFPAYFSTVLHESITEAWEGVKKKKWELGFGLLLFPRFTLCPPAGETRTLHTLTTLCRNVWEEVKNVLRCVRPGRVRSLCLLECTCARHHLRWCAFAAHSRTFVCDHLCACVRSFKSPLILATGNNDTLSD